MKDDTGADCILKEDQVKKAKAGVLVYKDKQTSCALAAIDSKAAVVAADCLDKHIIEIDPREYSVYFNDGIDGKTARYNVENITLVYDEPFYEQGAKELSKNPNFSMNKTSSATDSHVSVITGNLYVNQTTDSESSSDFASNETGNSNNSQGTSSNSSDTSDQAGSSNTAGIIAGACIGAVGLLIICGVIYYVRLIRKKNPGIADPMRNNDFQNMLETSRPMQANVGDYHIDPLVDYDLPPIYEEVPSK
ncbi:hypothetical protein LPJ55_003524 [Coemansia sp. RSA 990]|nr:hypothetical protein LPJ55_003524 [Coemansia sp. RSA 990]